jgi:hypothetical protein
MSVTAVQNPVTKSDLEPDARPDPAGVMREWVGNPEDLLPAPASRCGVTIEVVATVPSGAHRREHCAISQSLLSDLSISVGMQIRVVGTGGRSAVFTVERSFQMIGIPPFPAPRKIRIYANSNATDSDDGGVFKLCGSVGGTATLPFTTCTVRNVPVSESTRNGVRTEYYDPPAIDGDFTEHVTRGNYQQIIALFPHGGSIDLHTGLQIEPFVDRLAEGDIVPIVWECRGGGGRAFKRWHITANDIHLSSFRGLFKTRFVGAWPDQQWFVGHRFAVAFHGFAVDDEPDFLGIIVGGRAPLAHKQTVQEKIESAITAADPNITVHYYVADIDGVPGPGTAWNGIPVSDYTGTGVDNLINRLCPNDGTEMHRGGIQIEQSAAVRSNETLRTAVARGVAAAMIKLLSDAGAA